MIGHHRVRYAIQTGDADPYALVDDAFLPLLVADPARIRGMARPEGEADEADDGPGPAATRAGPSRCAGAEVSSVRRLAAGGQLEVRVWNADDVPHDVEIVGRRGWLCDLRGAPVEPFDGRARLGPWRIATIVLAD